LPTVVSLIFRRANVTDRGRSRVTDLYSVAEARDRILRILGEGGGGETLGHFLPKQLSVADTGDPPEASLRLYSVWASTFSASLELAKQGDVELAQVDAFASVHVSRPTAPRPEASAM
jgi:segregation and condensation protein A